METDPSSPQSLSLIKKRCILLALALLIGTIAVLAIAIFIWAINRPFLPAIGKVAVPKGPLVYFTCSDGKLYALDAATGQQIWNDSRDQAESTPVVAGSDLYCGCADGCVALNATTGKREWLFKTGTGNGVETPTVSEEKIYFGCDDGYIYVLDAATGQLKWRFQAGDLRPMDVSCPSPTVSGNTIYYVKNSDYIALDANSHKQKWIYYTGDELRSAPTISGDNLYCASAYDYFALDAATGTLKWRFHSGPGPTSAPTLSGNNIYCDSQEGFAYALNAATGQQEWRFQASPNFVISPLVAGGTVYCSRFDENVMSSQYYIYALDPVTGKVKWKFSTGDNPVYTPLEYKGTLYCSSNDAYVYALNAVTGQLKWTFRTADGMVLPPTNSPGVTTTLINPKDTQNVLQFRIGSTIYKLDGQTQYIDDAPIIRNGRIYLPVEYLAVPCDARPVWSTTKQVTIYLNKVFSVSGNTVTGATIQLMIGQNTANVNGTTTPIDPKNPTVTPIVLNGKAMVPLSFVADHLGCNVEWNQAQGIVTVICPPQ